MTSHVKPVGIALSGDHLAALLADPVLAARLNAAGLPFAVAGVDRVDRAVPRPRVGAMGGTVEPTVAAAALAAWAPDLGWLMVTTADQDRPSGLAHRVASADQLSGGRVGLVLGRRDWQAAAAVRALWHDWPGAPVLGWRAETTGEAAAAGRVADVLIWPAGRPARLETVAAAGSGAPRLFLELPAGGSDLGARLGRYLADRDVAGVILRPEETETALRDFVAYVLPRLVSAGLVRTGWSGPLRERLALPVTELLPGPGCAPAPVPAREPALTS